MGRRRGPSLPATAAGTPFLYRELKPDWPGFFGKLGESLGKFDVTNPKASLAAAAPGLLKACLELVRLKPESIDQEAFRLVKRALVRAALTLLEKVELPAKASLRPDQTERLDAMLRAKPIELTSSFFRNPMRTPVVGLVARQLASWLRLAGKPSDEADEVAALYPAEFVGALAAELRAEPKAYERLTKEHQPKFADANEANACWHRYFAKLQARANPEVLDLGVSLDDVYIDLRATFEPSTEGVDGVRPSEPRKTIRVIQLLDDFAREWLEDPKEAILVLSGGPGSGKSMFARRFAAWRSWTGPEAWRVLYVPLHRFAAWEDIGETLKKFAAAEIKLPSHLSCDLFATDADESERLLIVFDGLDELSKAGRAADEVARDFYQRLDLFAKQVNGEGAVRMKVLVCGRPAAVAYANVRDQWPGRIRHLAPYRMDRHFEEITDWKGQPSLAEVDQRNAWWQRFGLAVGDPNLVDLPSTVKGDKLDPLTSEPILNALVAKCYRNPNRPLTPETSRADLYEWMLADVLRRVHDRGEPIIPAKQERVAEALEHVAVAAWHSGDVRAITETKVRDHCRRFNAEGLLRELFPESGKLGVSSLFLSFYFHESPVRIDHERTFEFSHKSYGEFLVARRIERFLKELHENLARRAWDDDIALQRWAQFFGAAALSRETTEFVRDLAEREPEGRKAWRKDIAQLFNAMLRQGMPMEKCFRAPFQELVRLENNAAVAFLVLNSACYCLGDVIYPINWAHLQSVGEGPGDWLIRITRRTDRLAAHLCGWDWTKAGLQNMRLSCADFSGANLSQASFGCSYFSCSRGAANGNMIVTRIQRTSLIFVTFRGANLNQANLTGADLTGAVLESASLQDADLELADIECADLKGANLSGANLKGANLRGANLKDANLEGAHLHGAVLEHAILQGANLNGTNLEDANLSGANVRGTILEKKPNPPDAS